MSQAVTYGVLELQSVKPLLRMCICCPHDCLRGLLPGVMTHVAVDPLQRLTAHLPEST